MNRNWSNYCRPNNNSLVAKWSCSASKFWKEENAVNASLLWHLDKIWDLEEITRRGSQHLEDSIVAGILTKIEEFLAEFLQKDVGWHLCA